jgi:hypothetical protein
VQQCPAGFFVSHHILPKPILLTSIGQGQHHLGMNTSLYIGWPQGIILAMILVHLGVHIALHGKRVERTYNALSYIFYVVFLTFLWFWGGFFNTVEVQMSSLCHVV